MLHLPSVRTFVYTIERYADRQQRMGAMLDGLGFTDWRFVYGGMGKQHYWQNVHDDYVELLKAPVPFLILEDDSTLTAHYQADLDCPADAQHLYLQGNTWALNYSDQPGDWFRVHSMWCGAAMLFIDEATKELIRGILDQRRDVPIDVALSDNLSQFLAYCLKRPYWYQQDGHNDWGTQHYYAEPVPLQRPDTTSPFVRRRARERRFR